MKIIESNKLIKVLKNKIRDEQLLSIDVLDKLLNEYGDDWFMVDGIFTMTKKNEKELNNKESEYEH